MFRIHEVVLPSFKDDIFLESFHIVIPLVPCSKIRIRRAALRKLWTYLYTFSVCLQNRAPSSLAHALGSQLDTWSVFLLRWMVLQYESRESNLVVFSKNSINSSSDDFKELDHFLNPFVDSKNICDSVEPLWLDCPDGRRRLCCWTSCNFIKHQIKMKTSSGASRITKNMVYLLYFNCSIVYSIPPNPTF